MKMRRRRTRDAICNRIQSVAYALSKTIFATMNGSIGPMRFKLSL